MSWSTSIFESHTDDLWEQIYNGPFNSSYIAPGVCGAVINICGWLQEHMLHDLLLLITWCMHGRMLKLVETLHVDTSDFDEQWKEYQQVKSSFNKVNDALGIILPLGHVNNMLLTSYFVLDGFEQQKYIRAITRALQVATIGWTYYLASKISRKVILVTYLRAFCLHNTAVTCGRY